MNGKKILISAAYFELLKRCVDPGAVIDASDFPKFLNDLKWRLKSTGKDELFNDIIREEIHMYETKDAFL